MATEAFIARDFKPETLKIIKQANQIIADYQAQGFTLTLRQLYYQFVARALIANKQTEYKRLGMIINDARMAGLIDWDAIEDRTRNLRKLPFWDDPADIISSAVSSFKTDLWATQKMRCEVWIEKDALIGVVEPVCNEFRIPYFACRGYTSQSEAYAAAKRIGVNDKADQGTMILHLGDHDPSGIDMTRDNRDRLKLFHGTGKGWRLVRLALNRDQIDQYNPPPNPLKEIDGKLSDSRGIGYQAEHGDSSWELDALEPTVIDRLVRTAVNDILDKKAWKAAKAQEADMTAKLQLASDRWDDVAEFLET